MNHIHIVSTHGTVPRLQVIMTFINTCMLLLTEDQFFIQMYLHEYERTFNVYVAACTLTVPSIDVQHCPKV